MPLGRPERPIWERRNRPECASETALVTWGRADVLRMMLRSQALRIPVHGTCSGVPSLEGTNETIEWCRAGRVHSPTPPGPPCSSL